ncbi:putative Serine/threonine protein kinase [Streptomyces viridochromogenes Tue57]|uniref:Putative Serine/threonine protein kinase n=1 Tax=Streptomyces viridochromogenes Tue57 TaxID=1160705 RepID=L8PK10_STRVR|nr:putative Serine/threonine protein kinase [Streptomyces viridochromogenes Tue57]
MPGGSTEARADAATRYARGTEELRLSPELPEIWREIVRDCLAPTHTERAARVSDTGALLRRVEEAAGASRSARLPRLRPRRWRRAVLVAAIVAVAMLGGTAVTYALRDDPPAAAAPPSCKKPAVYEDAEHGRGYTAGWSNTWEFVVKQGEGGSQVREAQCLLRYLHGISEVGEVDGDFGPLTHAAVVSFQKRAGLDADGIVGPRTWSALRKAGEA